jgi:hydrogenase nickel incorporation protein HypA/HybF
MHELSIATSLIALAREHLAPQDAGRVARVYLAIGALTSVHVESLRFSFDLVAEGTPLEGAELVIRSIPIAIHCPNCNEEFELEGIQSFRCPVCHVPSADIRRGRELDLEQLELRIDEGTNFDSPSAHPLHGTHMPSPSI